MTKHSLELLLHIRYECNFIMENSTDLDPEDLYEDGMKSRAFIRSIEIIGEASKSIPDEFKDEHEEIPWKVMAGMRDILIHRYSGVDLKIVYDVVQNQIPQLLNDIDPLIDELK